MPDSPRSKRSRNIRFKVAYFGICRKPGASCRRRWEGRSATLIKLHRPHFWLVGQGRAVALLGHKPKVGSARGKYTMKLKFPVALAAAVLLAGAGFSFSVPEAWGHTFSMPSSGGVHFAPRTFGGNALSKIPRQQLSKVPQQQPHQELQSLQGHPPLTDKESQEPFRHKE